MKLHNQYFIMRHGQSEANVARLLTSDPEVCKTKYGLTETGREQAATSVHNAMQKGWLDDKTIIYSSDLLRTVQTAEIARKLLNVRQVHKRPALRERNMGKYEGKKNGIYHEIWPHNEEENRVLEQNEVEGSESMSIRLLDLIKNLEAQHKNITILLVSHGDPLQVLQSAFANLDAAQSRELDYIRPAEIRKLTLTANLNI